MVNVQATNDKLRARAVRLVQALTKCSDADAQAALEKTAWRVTKAVETLKRSRR
jgi:N-acetylmuramic acid 6-phosphate (MurNAc-6-P) etherase